MDSSLIFGLLRWLALPYWRLLRWFGRRPFVLSSVWWTLALFGVLAAAFFAYAAGAPALVFIALGLIALLALSALAGWLYLRWPAEEPVVFVTKFATKTSLARDAATDHLDALSERIENLEELGESFEIRRLSEPMSLTQADLLLAETGAAAVLFGEVRAIDGSARWKLQMLIQWPSGDGGVTNIRVTGPKKFSAERFTRSQAPAPRHEQIVDANQPLRRLAGETFESDHADRAAGTLLVFAADLARRSDPKEMSRCLEAARPFRDELSPRTLAAFELMTLASEIGDLPTLVTRLEAAGESGADHPDLWNALLGFALLMKAAGELDSQRFLDYAIRAVRADPTDAQSHYNLGEAYMANGDIDDGLAEFEALTDDEEYSARPYLHMGIGVIHYNHTHEYDKARDAYAIAARLSPSPQAFLYLADAQRTLCEDADARDSYRKALLLDPTLVDAHRGYTAVAGGINVAPPLFNRVVSAMAEARTSPIQLNRLLRPVLWRLLRWHYQRHPEDSRLHYMLGFCALLRQQFNFAIERLIYAYELFEGADLEALAVAAAAKGLKGEEQESKADLITLRDAPLRPGFEKVSGSPDTPIQRAMAVVSPFIWEPRLSRLPTEHALQRVWHETFAGSFKRRSEPDPLE